MGFDFTQFVCERAGGAREGGGRRGEIVKKMILRGMSYLKEIQMRVFDSVLHELNKIKHL
jgi:hypothetical protein